MFDADVIHAEKQQISQSDKTKQDDNKGESEKKEDKIFVRPRFVKVNIFLLKLNFILQYFLNGFGKRR